MKDRLVIRAACSLEDRAFNRYLSQGHGRCQVFSQYNLGYCREDESMNTAEKISSARDIIRRLSHILTCEGEDNWVHGLRHAAAALNGTGDEEGQIAACRPAGVSAGHLLRVGRVHKLLCTNGL